MEMNESSGGLITVDRSDSDLAREMQEQWSKDETYAMNGPEEVKTPIKKEETSSSALNVALSPRFDRSAFHRADSIAEGTVNQLVFFISFKDYHYISTCILQIALRRTCSIILMALPLQNTQRDSPCSK